MTLGRLDGGRKAAKRIDSRGPEDEVARPARASITYPAWRRRRRPSGMTCAARACRKLGPGAADSHIRPSSYRRRSSRCHRVAGRWQALYEDDRSSAPEGKSSAPSIPTRSTTMNDLAGVSGMPGSWTWPCRSRGDAQAQESQARPRTSRHAQQHEQPRRVSGCREAGPGPAALRGDAQAQESQARPRTSRHARQHEQPRRGVSGMPGSWTWPCRSSRRR